MTVAECEDGIPPEPTSCFASHRFSLYLHGTRAADADPVRERERELRSGEASTEAAWEGGGEQGVPGGEDLDGLRYGEGEHGGDERAVVEHGQVGERGRARRRRRYGGGAGDDGFRHGSLARAGVEASSREGEGSAGAVALAGEGGGGLDHTDRVGSQLQLPRPLCWSGGLRFRGCGRTEGGVGSRPCELLWIPPRTPEFPP